MITLRLWRILNHPPASSPIFWRVLRQTRPAPAEPLLSWSDRLSLVYLVLFGGLILFANRLPLTFQLPLIPVLLFLLSLPLVIPLLLILRSTLMSGSVHGIQWGLSISGLILSERLNHTYDLLRILPGGVLPCIWAISTGYLYANQRLNNAAERLSSLTRIISFTVLTISLLLALHRDDAITTSLSLLLAGLLLIIALRVDFMQSVIVGLQLGIITGLVSLTAFETKLWFTGTFLLIQANTCLAGIVSSLLAAPLFPGDFQPLAYLTAGVIGAALLREAVLVVTWGYLLHQLDSGGASAAPRDQL